MSTNPNISALSEILEKLGKFVSEGDLVTYNLEGVEDRERILTILSEIGYTRAPNRTLREDSLVLSLSASNWGQTGTPVFRSWSELHKRVSARNVVPDYIVLEELSGTDNTEHHNHKRLQLFCCCRELLAKLADHCEPKSGVAAGRDRVLFLIDADTLTYKYDLTPTITWEGLAKLDDIDSSLEAVKQLLTAISLNDSQDSERRSVMRSAFAEIMSSSKVAKATFPLIIYSVTALLSKYTEHHELFINRFSVNKVIQEISQQDLQYTSKINEIIASAQTKALTIPGALIAIGAAMKIDSLADAIAVSAGLCITTVIVHLGTGVHLKTYSHLEQKIKTEFERYDCLAEKAAIRKKATKTKNDLLEQADTAQTSLSRIRIGIWVSLMAALIYIAFSYCSNVKSDIEPSSSSKEVLATQVSESDTKPPQIKSNPTLKKPLPEAVKSQSIQTQQIQPDSVQ